MVAPIFKPLGWGTFSAVILVTVQSLIVSSLPAVAYIPTAVGPFLPIIASALSRRKAVSDVDSNYMYEPLYEELERNKERILSSEQWANIPMFQREKLDQIRKSARYSLLKDRTPAVEILCKSMDSIFSNQGDANRAADRIIRGMTGKILGVEGDGISFHGRTKDGSISNFDSSWTRPLVIWGRDPLTLYRQQVVDVTSMGIMDRNSNIKGSLTFPMDEEKYRKFWENVEKAAKNEPQIKAMRDLLSGLSTLVNDAEAQVLDKVNKSRRPF